MGIEERKGEEVKEVEEREKIEKREKIKGWIEEKERDRVVWLEKEEKGSDDGEVWEKWNDDEGGVEMRVFEVWGMEEEKGVSVDGRKKKGEVRVGGVGKKV